MKNYQKFGLTDEDIVRYQFQYSYGLKSILRDFSRGEYVGEQPVVLFFGKAELFFALFRTLVSCNQLIRGGECVPVEYVFHRPSGELPLENLPRILAEFAAVGDYDELPSLPCTVTGLSGLAEMAEYAEGKNALFLVDCGEDGVSLGRARELKERYPQKDVFVRLRGEYPIETFGAIPYGKAEDGDLFLSLAALRYSAYAGREYTAEELAEKWKTPEDWDINIHATLSLEEKLNSIGFTLGEEDDEEEFLRLYEEGDPILRDEGGRIIFRGVNFNCDSLRYLFAEQEHLRWNADMFARGYLPASLTEQKTLDKAQLKQAKKHANLCSMEGLYRFRERRAAELNKTVEETDVIRYDFQIMDEAPAVARVMGKKISRMRRKYEL